MECPEAKQMATSILITGGCRSGKSSQALTLAEKMRTSGPCVFMATCVPQDDEMRARVRQHQNERGAHWKALEVPVEVTSAILDQCDNAGVIVIDCLTLWVNNMMAQFTEDAPISQRVASLGEVMMHPPCPVILVTNEVGCGIVPANPLSRRFRDLVGWTNQQLAAQCHEVIWMVAGIPVPVKS